MNKNTQNTQETILAKKIRRVREHLGLSRPKFAKLLNMSSNTLKNYELCYRTSIPATLLQKFFMNAALSKFVTYLLDDKLPVEHIPLREVIE